MKRVLFIFALLTVMPAWSLCSVESGESICTLQNNSSPLLFQNNNTGMKNNGNNNLKMNDSSALKNPADMNSSFGRTQNKSGIQMQGSLGCQFGNCNAGKNNP